jgi:hypothetical protein
MNTASGIMRIMLFPGLFRRLVSVTGFCGFTAILFIGFIVGTIQWDMTEDGLRGGPRFRTVLGVRHAIMRGQSREFNIIRDRSRQSIS